MKKKDVIKRIKYEYMTCETGGAITNELLGRMGEDGWEAFHIGKSNLGNKVFLKRIKYDENN